VHGNSDLKKGNTERPHEAGRTQMKLLYPATITHDPEDNGYLVEFTDLPGCISEGETLDEALSNGREALTGYLSSLFERNIKIPVPSTASSKDSYLIEPDPDVAIPIMLRNLRDTNKLTQSDVAKVIGVSYQAYQRLEKPGKSNPTMRTLDRLARVFHKHLHVELA
jgi:antitoxin HicB